MAAFIPIGNFSTPEDDSAWKIWRKEILPVPPERTWKALTDPKELSNWLCDSAEVNLKVGGQFRLMGESLFDGAQIPVQEHEAAPSEEKNSGGPFEILELTDNELLSFRWNLGNFETRVTFKLENQFEQSHLLVSQTADVALPWPSGQEHPNWWWLAMVNLRNYVENGLAPLKLNYSAAFNTPSSPLKFSIPFTTFPWVIWKKLVDPNELKGWWSEEAKINLTVGESFDLGQPRFHQLGSGAQKLLACEEEKLLSYNWIWPDESEGKVSWKIEEGEVSTVVTLEVENPYNDPLNPLSLPLEWATKILYLKQMAERGVSPLDYQE